MAEPAIFYNRSIRKMVIGFGTLFNNVPMVRYNYKTGEELERIRVPLTYSSKEKFYNRIFQNPDLINPVQVTLPRMAFELNDVSYDRDRKLSTFNADFERQTVGGVPKIKSFRSIPYNLKFSLYIFVRNTEDGLQIVENILSNFTPDYTVTFDFLGLTGIRHDVPVILDSMSKEDTPEGDPESTRSIIWTLNFTMRGFLFSNVNSVGIIKKSTANVYNYSTQEVQCTNVISGDGIYKIGEYVFQGSSPETASASGYLKTYTDSNDDIVIAKAAGKFKSNVSIRGVESGATRSYANVGSLQGQVVSISVEPDPSEANSIDEIFGYTTTIEEFI